MCPVKFSTIQKILVHLWMATFGESDNKILFFNNNEPPESNRTLFLKKYAHKKNISYEEKDVINKVKCFTENR